MTTVKELSKTTDKNIFGMIIRRFGNFRIDNPENIAGMSDAQAFNELARFRGVPKSHCSNKYPKHEWEKKDS